MRASACENDIVFFNHFAFFVVFIVLVFNIASKVDF